MTKKQIEKLVEKSYDGKYLDEQRVEEISNSLNRKNLKEYIRALKTYERKTTVIVSMPTSPTVEEKEKLKSVFQDKKIVYEIDPSLIAGIRVVNGEEWIYDLNIKNSWERILDDISEVYE